MAEAETGAQPSPATRTPPALPELLKRRPRKPFWVRMFYLAGALIACILGIVGWLVPVVTGIPFYIVALALLALASNRGRKWINRVEAKLSPPLRLKLRRALYRVRWKKFHDAFNFPDEELLKKDRPSARERTAPREPGDAPPGSFRRPQ